MNADLVGSRLAGLIVSGINSLKTTVPIEAVVSQRIDSVTSMEDGRIVVHLEKSKLTFDLALTGTYHILRPIPTGPLPARAATVTMRLDSGETVLLKEPAKTKRIAVWISSGH